MGAVESLRQRLRDWLSGRPVPGGEPTEEQRFHALRQWQTELHNAGFLGLSWPPEYGGKGLTPLHQVAVYQELATAGAPAPAGEIGLEIVGQTILAYGTESQKKTLLPRILTADDIWCQGFSEPEAGSDLAALRTRAEEVEDGYLVNGQKTWSSWATYANKCALLVRTDSQAKPKHKGITYLVADLDVAGISIRPIEQLTGASEFAEIFLTDVFIPKENVLGDRNRGFYLAMHTIAQERGPYLLKRSSELENLFRKTAEALASAGGASSDMRLIAQVGRMRVALDALHAQARETAEALLTGRDRGAADSVDKLILTRYEQEMTATMLDIVAGSRSTTSSRPWGLDAAKYTRAYLYGRSASIYGGTSEIQRNIVAERILELPKG